MPLSYTPSLTPVNLTFPVLLPLNGELIDDDSVNTPLKALIDDAKKTLDDLTEDKGVMSALQTKLGLPVIDSSDTVLPTYGGAPFLLTGALTYQTALETLDAGIKGNSDALVNVDANVGGLVTGTAPPVYGSGHAVFPDGSSHHAALELLEDYAAANRTLATSATADATTALASATNTAAKVGIGAELAPPFTYASTEIITDGDTLKVIAELLDAHVQGDRLQTDRNFASIVKNNAAPWALAADFTFYETFIDTTKADISTTAVLNTFLRDATGDGLEYVAVVPITITPPHASVALIWEVTGTVTFSVNLIGSLLVGDYEPVPTQNTYVLPASGAGATLVVKAVISGAGSKIHNIGAFTKV